MAWVKGQSGNPGGKPTQKLYRQALMMELKRRDGDDSGRTLRQIASNHITKALEGDLVASKEIVDRLDGKPVQPLAGSDDDAPITVRQIITGVPRPGDEAPEE